MQASQIGNLKFSQDLNPWCEFSKGVWNLWNQSPYVNVMNLQSNKIHNLIIWRILHLGVTRIYVNSI
jgi:hypothetical protein